VKIRNTASLRILLLPPLSFSVPFFPFLPFPDGKTDEKKSRRPCSGSFAILFFFFVSPPLPLSGSRAGRRDGIEQGCTPKEVVAWAPLLFFFLPPFFFPELPLFLCREIGLDWAPISASRPNPFVVSPPLSLVRFLPLFFSRRTRRALRAPQTDSRTAPSLVFLPPFLGHVATARP